jgi:hypothetical protein
VNPLALLSGLGSRVWAYLAAAGIFLAVLARAYLAGRKSAVADQREKTLESVGRAKEAEDAVSGLEPSDVHKRLLDRWSR